MHERMLPLGGRVAGMLLTLLLGFGSAGAGASELRIYCGVTMVRPMGEIAKLFEQQQSTKVTIIPGGSGDLKMMLVNLKNGDLYLPGEDQFITELEKTQPGLVVEKRHLGNNRAALVVKKGNPKQVTGLKDLLRTDLKVVLGHPERGSIGKATAALLKKHGSYDRVMQTVTEFEPESKNLMNAVKFEGADLTVNWRAVTTWPENRELVEAVAIPEEVHSGEKLVLATLGTSADPKRAAQFLALAASPAGRAIFASHGF